MRPRLGRASGIVERSDTLLELRDAKRVILRRRADRRRDRLALPCLVLPPVTTGGRILPDGASRRARAARRLPFVCIRSTDPSATASRGTRRYPALPPRSARMGAIWLPSFLPSSPGRWPPRQASLL